MEGKAVTISTPVAEQMTKTRKTNRRRFILSGTELQIFIAVVVLAGAFSAIFPDSFATTTTLNNMARVAGILAVVSIGQTFALIIGGFDISVGATMGLASVVSALLMKSGYGVGPSVVLAVLATAGVGLVNGVGIAVFRVTPFVMTLGMLTAVGGLANQLANGGSIIGLPRTLSMLGRNNWGLIPSAAAIALIVLVITWAVLQRTRAGLYIYSIGGSRETSKVAGIPVAAYELLAYVICSTLAGLAGVMLTARIAVAQGSLGQGYDLLSIATAVIGGVAIGGGAGRLSGVVLGVIFITVLTTGLDIAGVNPFVQQIVTGTVLVVAVIVSKARGTGWKKVLRLMHRD
jgi:ribose/xylose/arabinose/galactoside ABC-type transport system permease subunit